MLGHTSDVIDRYQITSESQKVNVSKVLAKKPEECIEEEVEMENVDSVKFKKIPLVSEVKVDGKLACSCKMTYSSDESNGQNVADLIKGIVEANKNFNTFFVKVFKHLK